MKNIIPLSLTYLCRDEKLATPIGEARGQKRAAAKARMPKKNPSEPESRGVIIEGLSVRLRLSSTSQIRQEQVCAQA